MTGGVQTLRNVSAYKEPTWHFDAQFIDNQGHAKANVQKAPGHGNEEHSVVNAIYIVYKIRDYDGTGTEHNYLFSCGMNDNHRGVCCLKDERTMRVYGVADKPHYMDISNFHTSCYNPCRKDMWNVVCVVYDTTSGKSSL